MNSTAAASAVRVDFPVAILAARGTRHATRANLGISMHTTLSPGEGGREGASFFPFLCVLQETVAAAAAVVDKMCADITEALHKYFGPNPRSRSREREREKALINTEAVSPTNGGDCYFRSSGHIKAMKRK